MKRLLFCLIFYFTFSFFPVFALIAYSPQDKILIATDKGSKTIWYQSLADKEHQWKPVNGLASVKGGFNDLIYADNKFIGIGDNTTIYYSLNGIDWNIVQGLAGKMNFNSIIHTKSHYMAVVSGSPGVWASKDGIKWNPLINTNYLDLRALFFDDDHAALVAVGGNKILYALLERAIAKIIEINDANFNDVVYGQDKFVVVGNKIYYSYDAETWIQANYSGAPLHKIKYIPSINQFIAVGENRNIWYSNDGVNWTQAFIWLDTPDISMTFLDVSNPDRLLVGGQGNHSLLFSTDHGKHWGHVDVTCGDGICKKDTPFQNFDSLVRLENGKYIALTKPVNQFDTYLSFNGASWEKLGPLLYEGKIIPPDVYGESNANHLGMTITPDGKRLYVTNPFLGSAWRWYIAWYDINPNDGSLTYKGKITPNELPINVVVSADGKYLYLTSWHVITAYQIASDGSLSLLGPVIEKSEQLHLEGSSITPDGKYLYSYGGYAKLTCYQINSDGTLTYRSQMTVDQDIEDLFIQHDGDLAYSVSILGDITVYEVHPSGMLNKIKRYKRTESHSYKLTMPPNQKTFYVAVNFRGEYYMGPHYIRELKLTAKDKLLDGIRKRAPREEDETQAGIGPVGLAISPNGKYLYMGSNSGRIHWFSF